MNPQIALSNANLGVIYLCNFSQEREKMSQESVLIEIDSIMLVLPLPCDGTACAGAQWQEALTVAVNRLERSLLSIVYNVIDAWFEALQGRLPSEQTLWPSLAVDTNSTADQSAPKSLYLTYIARLFLAQRIII